ncbi:MAG: hypothetical protein Q4P72_03070 [Eubacteriales bacterium]|nr:hypothetical protein [Eubacteriales bacterium]
MHKTWKLYSLAPLLAGILLLTGLGYGRYSKQYFLFDDSNDINFDERFADHDPDSLDPQDLDAPHWHLKVGPNIAKEIFHGEKTAYYDLLVERDRFLIQKSNRKTRMSSRKLEALQREADVDNRLLAYIDCIELKHWPESTGGTYLSSLYEIRIEMNFINREAPLWQDLESRSDCYFRCTQSSEGLILEAIPSEGLRSEMLADDDEFVLLNKLGKLVILRSKSGLEVKTRHPVG